MTEETDLAEMKKLYPKDLQELIGGLELEAPVETEAIQSTNADPIFNQIEQSMAPIINQKYADLVNEVTELRGDKRHQNALIDGNRRSMIEKKDLGEMFVQEWSDNTGVFMKKPSGSKAIISDYKWPIIIGMCILLFLGFQGSPTIQGDINSITSDNVKLAIVSLSGLGGLFLFLRANRKRNKLPGT